MWAWIKRLFTKPAPIDNSAPVIIKKPSEVIISNTSDWEFTIYPYALQELLRTCKVINDHIEKYKYVEAVTSVPWDVVAACHYREADLDFKTCLHNGDPLPGPTTHVPKGRGPFNSWEAAAVDSLIDEKHNFPIAWDLPGKLAFCESYNGLGYQKRGIPSPYVWASTDKYKSGLYVADGKFNPDKVDQRLGCAAIIKTLKGAL